MDTYINLAVASLTGPHMLSQSTVVDTCGSSHIVNDISMLQEGSFVPAPPGRVVEAGSSAFSIRGTGTRVIKGALLGVGGVKLDLTLRNVDLVEGFHTNIISEALLRDAKIWYCGEDCTLRVGLLANSVVVRQLQRIGNLAFLEYKPLYSSCSDAPQPPLAPSGTVRSFAVVRRAPTGYVQVKRLAVRKDSEAMWHVRTGHLGVTALRMLPERSKNVGIAGEPMGTCEVCRLAHANRVISRRPTERALRPFFKIL